MSISLKDKLAGKTGSIKISYLEEPSAAKFAETDEYGIWIDGGDILAAFHQHFQRKSARGMYSAIPAQNPVIFVPYCHVQWLAISKP